MESKWTLESANEVLKTKSLFDIISIIDIQDEILIVLDKDYGEYKTLKKNLAFCMKFPLHKKRKHLHHLNNLKEKYLNKVVHGRKILDIFYGQDHGYKNRSFYFKYEGNCGHILIDSYAVLKNKKGLKCLHCSASDTSFIHGERKRINGQLKRRSSTYIAWVSNKSKLDPKYHDFNAFKEEVGEKPMHSSLQIQNNKPSWLFKEKDVDKELNLISQALRQAFRYSKNYKKCCEEARVETEEGVRYQCAICKQFFKWKEIHVDHIVPIQPLDGTPLERKGLIEKVWDSPIQILDRECHIKKTSFENTLRKEARKNEK